MPIAARWLWRSTGGQLIFRHRVVKPRPAGTLALPGDAAALREWEDPETGAAMIHDPHAQTLTAVVGVTHPAFVLLDPGEQERRVTGWGRVLATTCRSGRIARPQVSERTLPDSGSGLAEWRTRYGNDDDSWPAVNYRELISRAGPAGERPATTISLALDIRACARQIRSAGGGMKGERTFSMTFTPVRADVAARDIRKKKVGLMSDATQRARMGQIEDAERAAEFQDVLQQESDLTAGHGVLRYTGRISVSARTEDQLEEAVSAIEQAAVQASCETRRLVGQQAQAFAVAALPLCRVV